MFLLKNNLMDKPEQIINVDESGVPLDYCSPRIIARKGQIISASGKKSQITIVACINAIGQTMPPIYNF